MRIQDALAAAGVDERTLEGRPAEVALLPDEPNCQAWMAWVILSPDQLRKLVRGCVVRGKVDDDLLAEAIVRACCVSVNALNLADARLYGVLPFTHDGYLRVLASMSEMPLEDLSRLSEEQANDLAREHIFEVDGLWLLKHSPLFQARAVRLQETAEVLASEDALRRKRSAVTCGTSACGVTAQTAGGGR